MSDLSITAVDDRLRVQQDRVMIYAVLAAGTAAAMTVSPVFWLATPVLGILQMRASRAAARPIEPAEPDHTQLPMRVELAIHDAVAQLPPGDARRLLGDVARQARPLFGMMSSHFDAAADNVVRAHACDLVVAACDTALELARLDTLIESGSRAQDVGTTKSSTEPARPADGASLVERYTAARELFASRLTDAAAALGALYASGVEHGTPASDLVAELASDLSADAAARRAARKEMDELLGQP